MVARIKAAACLSVSSSRNLLRKFVTGAPRPKHGSPDSAIRATVAMIPSAMLRACKNKSLGFCSEGCRVLHSNPQQGHSSNNALAHATGRRSGYYRVDFCKLFRADMNPYRMLLAENTLLEFWILRSSPQIGPKWPTIVQVIPVILAHFHNIYSANGELNKIFA